MSIDRITKPVPLVVMPITGGYTDEQDTKDTIQSSIFTIPVNRAQENQEKKAQQKKQNIYMDSNGQLTTKEQALALFAQLIGKDIKTGNDKVIRHEKSHQTAAKGLSGSPVYIEALYPNDPLSRSYYTSGYVTIAVPHKIDRTASLKQIEETRRHAQITKAAAEAPASFDELSNADRAVAAKSAAVLSSAEVAKHKREELNARLAINGEYFDGKLTLEQVTKAENPQIQAKKPEIGKKINFVV